MPVSDIIVAADKIKQTWIANPTFTLGEMKLEDFTAIHARVVQIDSSVGAKRHELQGLLDQRDDDAKLLKDLNSRALSGFRAVFGADSLQYDQAGGTRRTQRHSSRVVTAKSEAVSS